MYDLIRLSVIGWLLLAGSALYAAEPSPLTLNLAIKKTLTNHPQLYQYRLLQDALVAQQHTSQLKPPLSLEVALEEFAGADELSSVQAAETTLALSSVIELGDKPGARSAVLQAKITQQQWQEQVATLDLLGDVTAAFIQALATQAHGQLAQSGLELAQASLHIVSERVQQGLSPEVDQLRAQHAVAQAQIRVAALEQRWQRQRRSLALFWRDSSPEFVTLAGDLYRLPAADDFESLQQRVLASPAMQVLASDARVKQAELALAQANARSDLTWRVGVTHFAESSETALSASLSLPLFSAERSQSQVRAARAHYQAQTFAQQSAQRQLMRQLFYAHSLYVQHTAAVSLLRHSSIPALERALALSEAAYSNGRDRFVDLALAQQALLAAQQSVIEEAASALLNQALIEGLTRQTLVDHSATTAQLR